MITTANRIIPFAKPWINDDDRQAVMEVLSGTVLTHGPHGKAFESEFGVFLGEGAHCISVSSCMAALHLAYLHFKLGPGDEVIVPAQTHTATVHAVEWVGATPVFVDCDPMTGNINVAAIEAAITPKTKAISLVHFVGIPCDMPAIMAIAKNRGLKVIEDCAIALGSRFDGTHVGLFGDAGCFSFYPAKHMTTAEGGMFISRHRDVVEAVAKLRAFGVDRTHSERTVPGMYDVPSLGLNYRMSELQASLGRSQLRRIRDIMARYRENFITLKNLLSKHDDWYVLDAASPRASSSYYCLSVILRGDMRFRRNELVAKLNVRGVGTSIYYPQPVPRMAYYQKKYGYDANRYMNAAEISDCSIALPVGSHLSPEDASYIGEQFLEAAGEMRNV